MKTNSKIREAIYVVYNSLCDHEIIYSKERWHLIEVIEAALAEPVHNYEVGTAQEQTARFAEFCKSHIHSDLPKCAGCPLEDIPDGTGCAQAWAQLQYEAEEGGAK